MEGNLFCEACIASGTLCSACQAKLDKGEACALDLTVAQFVFENRDKLALSSVRVDKCLDDGHAAIIITQTDPGLLIGKGGRVAEALARKLNRRVKVLGKNAKINAAASELLSPVRLLGVNEIYSQAGKSYRIRIARRDAARLPVSRETASTVLGKIYGAEITLSIE